MNWIKNKKIKKIVTTGMEFTERLKEHHLAAYSTYVSFYILFSFIPFLLGVTEIISATALQGPFLKTELWEWIPANMLELIQGFVDNLNQKRSGFTLPIAGLAALWSASKGAMALMEGLNIAFEIKEKGNFILNRIFAFLFTIGFMLLVFASGIVLVFGEMVLEFLKNMIHLSLPSSLYIMKNWIPFFMLIVMISTAYYSIARKKFTFKQIIPGAVVATAGFMLSALAMTYYLQASTSLSYMYGSLAGLAGIMMWINICSTCILLGAEINTFLNHKGYLKVKTNKKD